MRRIDRGAAPLELNRLLAFEPDRTWSSDGIPDVIDAIRRRLWSAQDGLCAYCEAPIDPQHFRVEHIHPRSLPPCITRPTPNHHFEWSNLLAVCTHNGTCDEAKQDHHLCDDIVFPDTIESDSSFTFSSLTGAIHASKELPAAEFTLVDRAITELNLDDIGLRTKRRAAIHEAKRRVIDEGEDPAFVKYSMLAEGFPTALDFVCDRLS